MKRLLLAVVLVVGSQVAYGEFVTASEVLQQCQARLRDETNQDRADGFVCVGYLSGFADAQEMLVLGDMEMEQWCMPAGVDMTQLARVVVKHMEAHPEAWRSTAELSAGFPVATAYRNAFRCE